MGDPKRAQAAPEDFAAAVDAMTDGWKNAMGVRFTRATAREVVAELEIGPVHLQPLGVVHGGVHAGLVEAVASVGATLAVMHLGQYAIGLENHTSFLHAAREGTLRAIGHPVTGGRQSAVWEVDVLDDRDRVVATGRVRLLVIAQGAPLAGSTATLKR